MPVVQPVPFSYILTETADKLVITWPRPQRNQWLVGLFVVWTTLWVVLTLGMLGFIVYMGVMTFGVELAAAIYVGKFTAESSVVSCIGPFFLLFLAYGILLFGKGLHSFLWRVFGEEILEIDDQSFRLHFRILNLTKPREYSLAQISDWRTGSINITSRRYLDFFLKPIEQLRGIIVLKTKKRLVRFGNNIEEAEARQILRLIKQRFPAYPIHLD